MPADRSNLAARVAAATAQDTVRGLIFNAIFGVLREGAGEGAAAACDPVRKGTRTDFFTYPVTDFLRIIWDAVDLLEPKLGGADAAFFAIGHRACENVMESMVGRTLLAIGGNGGPRELLTHVPAGYKATVSYGVRTVEWPSERHARIRFAQDFLVPPFHCGVLAAVAERVGGRNVRATGRSVALLEAQYEVEWE